MWWSKYPYMIMYPDIVFTGQQVLYDTAECTPRTYGPQRCSQDGLYPRHCGWWLCPTILWSTRLEKVNFSKCSQCCQLAVNRLKIVDMIRKLLILFICEIQKWNDFFEKLPGMFYLLISLLEICVLTDSWKN